MRIMARSSSKATILMLTRENKVNGSITRKTIGAAK